MVLYFLRHGDAVRHSSLHDSERPLSDVGRIQAHAAGRFFASNGMTVNILLTSPLIRARETGDVIGTYVSPSRREVTDLLINGTNPRQLFGFLDNLDCASVLLVGHEPFISDTLSLLISGSTAANLFIGTCSFAAVEIEPPVRAGRGMLKQLTDAQTMMRDSSIKETP